MLSGAIFTKFSMTVLQSYFKSEKKFLRNLIINLGIKRIGFYFICTYMNMASVVWWLIKSTKVTAQFGNLETTQNLFKAIWLTFVYPSNSQILRCPFQQSFPTHAVFGSLLCSFSHSFNLLSLSLSLSLFSAYSHDTFTCYDFI